MTQIAFMNSETRVKFIPCPVTPVSITHRLLSGRAISPIKTSIQIWRPRLGLGDLLDIKHTVIRVKTKWRSVYRFSVGLKNLKRKIWSAAMTMPSQIAILNVSVCLRAAKIVLCARRRMSVNHFLESWLQLTKIGICLGGWLSEALRLRVSGVRNTEFLTPLLEWVSPAF